MGNDQCTYLSFLHFFYALKPLLTKHFNREREINSEKYLDKRNPGLSLQPAFIKRGCSL